MPDPVQIESFIPADPGPRLHTYPGSSSLIKVKRTVGSALFDTIQHEFRINGVPTGSTAKVWKGKIYSLDTTNDRLATVNFIEGSTNPLWRFFAFFLRLFFRFLLVLGLRRPFSSSGTITITVVWRRNGTGQAIEFDPVNDLLVLFEP